MKLPFSLLPRWTFLKVFRVDKPAGPYLWRLRVIDGPLFRVYLHHLVSPDDDRADHDHPYSFVSFVLWGSYVERLDERSTGGRVRYVKRRWFNWKPAPGRHRVVWVSKHCWTLLIGGPRVREWGFYYREEDDGSSIDGATCARIYDKWIEKEFPGQAVDLGWVDWQTFLGVEADQ